MALLALFFLSVASADAPIRIADAAAVDVDRGLAWVSLPGGDVAAIDLASGTAKVSTRITGRPLAVHDGEVLVLTERQKDTGTLLAVILDDNGAMSRRCETPTLPVWAQGGLHTGDGWGFSASAWWSGGTFVMRWTADVYYVGGPMVPEEMRHPHHGEGVWACVGGDAATASGSNQVEGTVSMSSPGSTFVHVGDRVFGIGHDDRGLVYREWRETGGEPLFERPLGVPYDWSALSADGKHALLRDPEPSSLLAKVIDARTGASTTWKLPYDAAWGLAVGKRWVTVAGFPFEPALRAYEVDGSVAWTVRLEPYTSFPIPYQ